MKGIKNSMKKGLKNLRLAGLLVMVSLLAACQTQPSQPTSSEMQKPQLPPLKQGKAGLQQVVKASVSESIVPDIKAWQQASAVLLKSSKQFCRQPTDSGLQDLQQQFITLYGRWNRVMPFDFGPLRDNLFFPKIHFIESMRQRGKIYQASIRKNFAQALVSEQPLNKQYFKKLKFTLVGMPALEILLFDEPEGLLSSYQQNPRQCQLLVGMSQLNQQQADYVFDGWTKGPNNYRQVFINGKLDGGEQPLSKMIFALQDYLSYIVQRKLNGTLDAQLSGQAWSNLGHGLTALKNLFDANGSTHSLENYLLLQKQQKLLAGFEKQFAAAQQVLQNQDKVQLAKAYQELIKLLQRPLPDALGLNLGMNFVDGD